MISRLSDEHHRKFLIAVNTDYYNLSKKTDKFRLNVDLKKVVNYDDLKNFYNNYLNYLSFLSKTQIEMILKDKEWSKTVYTILAANKFKKLLKTN